MTYRKPDIISQLSENNCVQSVYYSHCNKFTLSLILAIEALNALNALITVIFQDLSEIYVYYIQNLFCVP